jgi:anti-anti-sigma factor
LHDVTEIHTCYLHEKEILEDKNRLQKERTESLNKLAISVAHQLRNPTTAIGGFAGLLLKKADPDTFPAKYLESIVTSAGRLEDLVRSVRDYTSLPPVTLRRVPVSVFHEPIERRVRQKAAELSREVDVIFGGESFEVSIDPGLVEEALNEILDNAVESMTAGHGTVEVSITPEENSFLITIQDNGSGIPEENLPYVFDPFFTTKAVGIGMGLCLARQIITEHNGCIWIERSELSGTKVMIRIPRKAAFSIAKKGELEMEILDEIVGEVLVLKLKGRLDSTSAASLKDKVKDCVNKGRIFLVIDMTNIDFVDSSGLGSLVACLRSVNKMGGDIRIAGLQNRVRVVFELIRLHHIFEIFDNAENAVRDFQTSTKGAAT